ncbi:MAG: recombinase family protein [Planctomycetota bacterium]|jgi:hypothetical protein
MNRRKRERRRKRIAEIRKKRKLSAITTKPAKASNFLHWFKNYYYEHPDMVAILYNRESSNPQDYKHNHRIHEWVLRRKCKKLNIPVIGYYCETCSGKALNTDRQALLQAVRKARAMIKEGKHAVILATSTDRFLRNIDFHTKDNPDVLPTEAEFEKLKKLTRCAPLASLLHPDRSWKKVRGYQSKWGQQAKGNKGGRSVEKRPGWTISRQKKKLPCVRRLLKKGMSVTQISKRVHVARSTVSDWIVKDV